METGTAPIPPHLLNADEERFTQACALVKLLEAENAFIPSTERSSSKKATRLVNHVTRQGDTHIGSLGEGSLHLVLKHYITPDTSCHEVKVGARYVDVFLDGRVYEIQTRNFGAFRKKLPTLLGQYPVTVVLPAIKEKRIAWVDPETGEVSAYRKSPKKESVYHLFDELVYMKDYLVPEGLSFCVVSLCTEETKLLAEKSSRSPDGKRGALRIDRVPTALCDVTYFENTRALLSLFPDGNEFTAWSLSKANGIPVDTARKMLYCMCHAGFMTEAGTVGRKKNYRRIDG